MDSDFVHTLLNINNVNELDGHTKTGATWERFVIDQITRTINAGYDEGFFLATHAEAELDLLVVRDKDRLGFEIKRTTTSVITTIIRIALSGLKLKSIELIRAGEHTFQLSDKRRAVALTNILKDLKYLKKDEKSWILGLIFCTLMTRC